jgi:hypothetical protein
MALGTALAVALLLAQVDPLLYHTACEQSNVPRRIGTRQIAEFMFGVSGRTDTDGPIVEIIRRTTQRNVGISQPSIEQTRLASGLCAGMLLRLEQRRLFADKIGEGDPARLWFFRVLQRHYLNQQISEEKTNKNGPSGSKCGDW